MRLARLSGADAAASPEAWLGAVLARDVMDVQGRVALAKGHRLTTADAPAVAAGGEIHMVWLDEGDVGEDDAALRLASAVAGPGVQAHHPVESQVRLSAARRGLARVHGTALLRVNSVDGVTVFTVPDGTPVDAGRTLAGAKITPLAMPAAALDEACRRAGEAPGGLIAVQPFLPLRIAAVVRQRLGDRARARLEANLRVRAAWFGGSLDEIVHVGDDMQAIAAALRRAASAADVVLAAGVASVDPLDPTWEALMGAGAEPARRGLPVHPGSSYWLAWMGGTLVVGVASCGMLSRRSALDLLLVRRFTGEPLDGAFLAGLGHGGLLGPEASWRVPPYGAALDAEED